MNAQLTMKSILSVPGAFATISVRGEGTLYVDIIKPIDAAGVVIVRAWGVSTDRRLTLDQIVSASAAAIATREEMREIVARQRAVEAGRHSDPTLLTPGTKLDIVIRVARDGRERHEEWRGVIARMAGGLIEVEPVGCDGQSIEFTRDQLVRWEIPSERADRSDVRRAETNRTRLGLRQRSKE